MAVRDPTYVILSYFELHDRVERSLASSAMPATRAADLSIVRLGMVDFAM